MGDGAEAGLGHNGGPALEDEHVPPWGAGGVGTYFAWRQAHRAVWRGVPRDTVVRRQRSAEALGLSYDEYTLEIVERGRHLGPKDAARVEAIKKARPPLRLQGSTGIRAGGPEQRRTGSDAVPALRVRSR